MKDSRNAENEQYGKPLIRSIIDSLDELQKESTEIAYEAGVARDRLARLEPIWGDMDESVRGLEVSPSPYESGIGYLEHVRMFFGVAQQQTHHIFVGSASKFRVVSNSLSTVTGSTAICFPQIEYPGELQESQDWPYHEETQRRLEALDGSLGKEFGQILQVLQLTKSDRYRSALFSCRQVFDNLFGILAPDREVRNSEFWQPKVGDKPDQVTRQERIRYAAKTQIPDGPQSERLASLAKHMTDVYQELNRAHCRGQIDETKARAAVDEMLSLLHEWSCGIPL